MNASLVRAGLLALTLAPLAACPPLERPELPQAECAFNSDCPEGKVCAAGGFCTDACKADRDCPSPLVCVEGTCAPRPGECRRDADCPAGQGCSVNGTCAPRCQASVECGSGFTCLSGVCVSVSGGCTRNSECPPDRVCSSVGKCAAPCTSSAECDTATEVCSAGACIAKPASCASSTDCAAPDVCGASGTCARPCSGNAECPVGQRCAGGSCEPLPAVCAESSDCPSGKSCLPSGSCTDSCIGSHQCTAGMVCTNGICAPPTNLCVTSADCGSGKACSPNGECVGACTGTAECATGEECSNGACVGVGPTTAAIQGSATLTGLTEHAGISVVLRGPSNASALTALDGQYRFAGLRPGRYTLQISAASTREGEAELEVIAGVGATATAPAVAFTPVGELRGTATMQGATNHHSIQVVAVGSGLGATTDGSGAYVIKNVPIGTYQLIASAPLYTAGSVSGVAVTYGTVTTAPSITLVPAPTSAGSNFSFLSTPPTTALVGTPYQYTAVAGGGGVVSAVYAKVEGPPSMTIDALTGVVTYSPSLNDVGNNSVVLSATGGGATVYQIYRLEIRGPYAQVVSSSTGELDVEGSVVWASHPSSRSASRIIDGGVETFHGAATDVVGSLDSLEVVNGGAVTSMSRPGGTLSGAQGPLGVVSASWAGGTASGWSFPDTFTLASKQVSRTVSSIAVVDGDRITDVSYLSGTIQTFADGRGVPTAVSVSTGVTTSVTATDLTDSAGTWTAGGLVGRCLTDSAAQTTFPISANTSTTITVSSGDLTTRFWPERRYFVVDCSSRYAAYTLTNTAASFGAITGQYADLYLPGLPLGDYPIDSNDATSFTFDGPVNLYAEILALPSSGFYAVAPSSGHSVTVTDGSVTLPGGLAGTRRIRFDGGGAYAITASTATSITFTTAHNSLLEFAVGQVWRITDNSHRTSVTATFQTGGFTDGAFVGKWLYVDAGGRHVAITANTANTITVDVESWMFPIADWRGGYAAVTPSQWDPPSYQLTDSAGGLTSGALGGLGVFTLTPNVSWQPFNWNGVILSNTANSLTLENTNYWSWNLVRDTLAALRPGTEYAFGTSNWNGPVRMQLQASGSPGWSPDTLVGLKVAPVRQPTLTATIVANTANGLVVEVPSNSYSTFYGLTSGDALFLSRANGFVARLSDSAASFTPGQWVGHWLVAANGAVVGSVTANDATTLDVSITNSNYLDEVGVGTRYALAEAQGECSTTGRIPTTATLAGATLTPNAYQELETDYGEFNVRSNSTSSVELSPCPNQFGALVASVGQPGVLTQGGKVVVTLVDSSANHSSGALVGKRLALIDSGELTERIVANTATGLSIEMQGDDWIDLARDVQAGARYAITDDLGNVMVTAQTGMSLAAGALANRFVALHSRNDGLIGEYAVASHTASTLDIEVPYWDLEDLFGTGFDAVDFVTTSVGLVIRITDSAGTLAPGSLVGRALFLNDNEFEIVSNTATQLVAATSDSYSLRYVRDTRVYEVPGMDPLSPVLALPGGQGLVASRERWWSTASVWQLDGSSLVAVHNRLTTARALSVTPKTPIAGRFSGAVQQTPFYVLTDPTASWTPNEHQGAFVRVRVNGSWYQLPVVANTATTLTVYRSSSINIPAGADYVLDPAALVVAGTTLTPGELAGKFVRLNGVDLMVRSNTASEIRVLRGSLGTDAPELIDPQGGTAFVLDGLRSQYVSGLTREGSSGFAVAAADGVVRFDGTRWSRIGLRESSAQVATGTVSSYSSSAIVDLGASYTPNALRNMRVVTSGGIYAISSNTETILYLTSSFGSSPPLLGESYAIITGDGFFESNDVSASGGSLFVGTDNGLYKLSGTTWTRYTVQSTESAPGKADGLPRNDVARVAAASASEVWMSVNGRAVARFDGTSWTQFNVESTESGPGKRDGLPSNYVNEIAFGPGVVLFATNEGAAVLQGTSWTQHSWNQGLWTSTQDLIVGPGGDLWLAGSGGIYRYSP